MSEAYEGAPELEVQHLCEALAVLEAYKTWAEEVARTALREIRSLSSPMGTDWGNSRVANLAEVALATYPQVEKETPA